MYLIGLFPSTVHLVMQLSGPFGKPTTRSMRPALSAVGLHATKLELVGFTEIAAGRRVYISIPIPISLPECQHPNRLLFKWICVFSKKKKLNGSVIQMVANEPERRATLSLPSEYPMPRLTRGHTPPHLCLCRCPARTAKWR